MQGYHQVKLLNGINLTQANLSEPLIHFGQRNDAKFADSVESIIPENGIGIMNRGIASWDFLDQLSETDTLFVVRIKNNMKTEFNHE